MIAEHLERAEHLNRACRWFGEWLNMIWGSPRMWEPPI